MNKRILYSGYCIAQDCQYSFCVNYLDAGNGNYTRGLMECKYRGLHRPEVCKDCLIAAKIKEQP